MTEKPYQPPGCERIEVDERGVVASSTFELPPRLLWVHYNDGTEWLALHVAGHRRRGRYEAAHLAVCEILDVEAESSVPGEFIYVVRPVVSMPARAASTQPHYTGGDQ